MQSLALLSSKLLNRYVFELSDRTIIIIRQVIKHSQKTCCSTLFCFISTEGRSKGMRIIDMMVRIIVSDKRYIFIDQ